MRRTLQHLLFVSDSRASRLGSAAPMNIKANIFRSSLWSIFGTGSALVSNFVVFALLARLLQPVDFGLVAFAAVFIDLARSMILGSMPEELIRRKKWDETAASTAFWLNLAFALIFPVAIVAITVPLASAYGSAKLADVFLALSFSLLIDGMRGVHEAKLRREFGYKLLAIRTVTASLLGGIVGVLLAFYGFGVWALVASRLVAATLHTSIVLCSARWTPRLVFSRRECGVLLSFGADMMCARFLGQISGKVPDLAIGFVLGPIALAFFYVATRALNLLYQLAIMPLQTTSLSAFSRLDNATSVRRAYVRLTRTTALVSFPVFFGAAAIAPDFVVVCFGSQWQPSGAVMAALALGVLPATLLTFSQPALIAVGRTRLVLASNLLVLVMNSIVAFAVVSFGVVAVAVAQVVRAHLMAPIGLHMLTKGICLSFGQSLRSVAEPGIAAGLMATMVVLVRLALDDFPTTIRLTLCVMLGAAVYAVLLLTVARRYTAETMLELLPHLPAPARGLVQRLVPRI